jgi:hypothetical protein
MHLPFSSWTGSFKHNTLKSFYTPCDNERLVPNSFDFSRLERRRTVSFFSNFISSRELYIDITLP